MPITTLEELRAIIGAPRPTTPLKIGRELDEQAISFIQRSPFLLMATVDAQGTPQVSPKGDAAGFVTVHDPKTLFIPDRPGNRLIMGLQNLLTHPRLALLFLVPGSGETLRVEGSAEILAEREWLECLSARGRSALLALRVSVDRVFFHCAKALLRARLWEPGSWPDVMGISFGRIIAARTGGGPDAAAEIDQRVQASYCNDL